MQLRMLAVAALGASLIGTSAFAAGGGTTVATAVPFTPGQTVTSSTDPDAGVNFFKLTVGYGDLLTIGFGVPTAFQKDPNVQPVGMCLLPLGTDDFSLAGAPCMQPLSGSNAPRIYTLAQLEYRILRAGSYTIAVGAFNYGCINTMVQLESCNTNQPTVPYVLRVLLKAYTTMTLQAPTTARALSTITVRGLLKGRTVAAANIAIQLKHGGAWMALTTARAGPRGQFSAKVKLGGAGRYLVRALYGGDGSHQASRASTAVVVR